MLDPGAVAAATTPFVLRGALERSWTALQVRTLVLCAAVLFCDGFDLIAISYAAASIRQQLEFSTTELGFVFSAGVIGTVCGGVLLGPMADRIGTQRVMVASILLAAAATFATTLAPSFATLLAVRAVAGFGLGGVLPGAYAIASDYAPVSHKRTVLALVAIAMPLGGAAAGVCWILLAPPFGWHSVFWCGAVASLAIGVALWVGAPEALSFLWSHGHHDRLQKLGALLPHTVALRPGTPSAGASKGPLAVLAPEWRLLTLALWLASFLSLFAYFMVVNWLPSIAASSPSLAEAGAPALTWLQVGLMVGGLAAGIGMDRFNGYRLVGVAALSTAVLASLAGFVASPLAFITIAGLFGFSSSCAQGGINFIATTMFPPEARATIVAWTISVGRLGGVLGPVAGGLLAGGNLALARLMGVAALAFLLCGIVMLCLAAVRKDWR